MRIVVGPVLSAGALKIEAMPLRRKISPSPFGALSGSAELNTWIW